MYTICIAFVHMLGKKEIKELGEIQFVINNISGAVAHGFLAGRTVKMLDYHL